MKIENKIQKLKWYLKSPPPTLPFPHKNIKINGKEKKRKRNIDLFRSISWTN